MKYHFSKDLEPLVSRFKKKLIEEKVAFTAWAEERQLVVATEGYALAKEERILKEVREGAE